MSEEQQTEVVPVFGTSLAGLEDDAALIAAMEGTADEGARAGDVSFLSFSGKTGEFNCGIDNRDLEPDEPFLVAASGFELGYICWKEGKPASKRMALISQPRVQEPAADELGPFERSEDGWFRARAITMKSLSNKEQVYFSINSKSGVAAMAELQKDVLARIKSGQPYWPIVTLSKEKFESKGYKNFKPVFDVVSWVSSEDVQALGDPEADPMALLDGEATAEVAAPAPRKRKL